MQRTNELCARESAGCVTENPSEEDDRAARPPEAAGLNWMNFTDMARPLNIILLIGATWFKRLRKFNAKPPDYCQVVDKAKDSNTGRRKNTAECCRLATSRCRIVSLADSQRRVEMKRGVVLQDRLLSD